MGRNQMQGKPANDSRRGLTRREFEIARDVCAVIMKKYHVCVDVMGGVSMTTECGNEIMAPDATVMRAVTALEAYWGQK